MFFKPEATKGRAQSYLIHFCLPLGLRRFPMNGNAQISVIGFLF